jgi:glycosyltransferase involved in cell wall biosynthesis
VGTPDLTSQPEGSPPRLSICIATFNRGRFIAQTIDSIVSQLGPSVELLIVDGASSDDTEAVVAGYLAADRPIRYCREPVNSGVDGDYDKAVGYARGDYCWLMTDDDLMEPGAVARVLDALALGPDLVVANAQVFTSDFSSVLMDRYLPIDEDRDYEGASDSFFAEVAEYLSFIGGVIVKRALWMARNRSAFYGTAFVHVGVLLQQPSIGRIRVLAQPLIRIRFGNALWTARGFEIWMFKWPALIWSFAGYSDAAKSKVTSLEPWKSARKLIHSRAIGSYSLIEFRQYIAGRASPGAKRMAWLIALMPGSIANAISGLYCILVNRKARLTAYDLARSKHTTWISRRAAKMLIA